mmetsp:Transcript_155760/g.271013  ORF Transcript_155760/g.271013 Transcript_155760/m.271013 type:complete len:81 (-) Transcript_155760:357-599(-)
MVLESSATSQVPTFDLRKTLPRMLYELEGVKELSPFVGGTPDISTLNSSPPVTRLAFSFAPFFSLFLQPDVLESPLSDTE